MYTGVTGDFLNLLTTKLMISKMTILTILLVIFLFKYNFRL